MTFKLKLFSFYFNILLLLISFFFFFFLFLFYLICFFFFFLFKLTLLLFYFSEQISIQKNFKVKLMHQSSLPKMFLTIPDSKEFKVGLTGTAVKSASFQLLLLFVERVDVSRLIMKTPFWKCPGIRSSWKFSQFTSK
jgi:hypothetical protein